MTDPAEAIVEKTIDWVIRTFDPEDHESYYKCDTELRRVEALLFSTESNLAESDLLTRIRATRISLAADIGDAHAVIQQSESFLVACPSRLLDFFNVATLRLRALHALGEHRKELEEMLNLSGRPEIRGEHFVLLLESFFCKHPRSIEPDALLTMKMKEALEELRQYGYGSMPDASRLDTDFEQVVLSAAAELRRTNRARSMAILSEPPEQ